MEKQSPKLVEAQSDLLRASRELAARIRGLALTPEELVDRRVRAIDVDCVEYRLVVATEDGRFFAIEAEADPWEDHINFEPRNYVPHDVLIKLGVLSESDLAPLAAAEERLRLAEQKEVEIAEESELLAKTKDLAAKSPALREAILKVLKESGDE